MFSLPPGTRALIWMNVIVFLIDSFMGQRISNELALWPLGSENLGAPGFMPWQLLTYSFFHYGYSHIFFNMFGLYMFGADVERVWGRHRFLTYYFTCVLSAGLTQLVFSAVTGSYAPTVGASGGIFGLLLAFAWMNPRRTVVLLFPPIPMQAWVFVTIYGAIELFQGFTGTQADVAHFAHLGGMLGGWLMLRYGRSRR